MKEQYPFYVDRETIQREFNVTPVQDGKGSLKQAIRDVFKSIVKSFIYVKIDDEKKVLLNPFIYDVNEPIYPPSMKYVIILNGVNDDNLNTEHPTSIILEFFTTTPIIRYMTENKGTVPTFSKDSESESLPIFEHLNIHLGFYRKKYFEDNKGYGHKHVFNLYHRRYLNRKDTVPFGLHDGIRINDVVVDDPESTLTSGINLFNTLSKWDNDNPKELNREEGDEYFTDCFVNNIRFNLRDDDGEKTINIDELEELLYKHFFNI